MLTASYTEQRPRVSRRRGLSCWEAGNWKLLLWLLHLRHGGLGNHLQNLGWNGERERHRLAGAGELQRFDETRGARIGLRLHACEAEDAAHHVAQILRCLIVFRFSAERSRQSAIHMSGGGEPFDLRKTRGNLLREPGLRSEDVEASDGPGVVALADVVHELHHFVVAGDAVSGELRVDRVLDGG